METEKPSKLKSILEHVFAFFEERGIGSEDDTKRSLLHRFAHYWLLVGKSFIRNRCPVRASALAYTTLLALIPLLAVGVSIATGLLQQKGDKPIEEMIRGLVRNVAPMLDLEVKAGTDAKESNLDKVVTNITSFISKVNAGGIGLTGTIALVFVAIGLLRTIEATFNDIWGITHGRGWIASIIQYWATITLGPIVLLLVFGLTTGPHFNKTKRMLGLSLVSANDIKNPESLGRTIVGAESEVGAFLQKVLREGKNTNNVEAINLAIQNYKTGTQDDRPLRSLLAVSLSEVLEYAPLYKRERFAGIALRPETQRRIALSPTGHDLARLNRLLLEDAFPDEIVKQRWQWVSSFTLSLLPFFVLSMAFTLFYKFMPNTQVRPLAALVGGIVGGTLWLLNNKLSVIYVSKVASYGQIYGSLSIIPLFLIGMYFSWLILLFGAQVAYAFQNRQSYLQEKQAEIVNQRGREFVALRMMTLIAQRFQRGETPPEVDVIASTLGVPTRLVSQLLQPLMDAKLIVEVANGDTAYDPARPLDKITAHDILVALRTGQGLELETLDDGSRALVREKFESIYGSERETAGNMTLEMLAKGATTDSLPGHVRLA